MYRFFLDDIILTDEPQGWDKFITTIKRDRILKGILKTIDTSLQFVGDGYNYLKNILDTQSFCGTVKITIQKTFDNGNTWNDFYVGTVFISSIEFDEKRNLAKCKIEDNSFYARINNNKSQDCLLHAGKTKNGKAISATPLKTIQFFNPTNGTYYPVLSGTDKERSCAGYKVYDVLKFLIQFMTDDTVSFDSITFGTGGEWEGLMLTYGLVLANVQSGLSIDDFQNNFPRLAYQKVFQEIDRLINIGFYVDYTTSKPTLFIESQKLLFKTNSILTTSDIDELKTSTAVDYLYSKLRIGSNNYDSNPLLAYPDGIDWIGFKDEEYNILGECNLDRELDITRDFVVDTNAIQDAVDTTNFGTDVYNENIFLIHCDYDAGVNYKAHKSNILTAAPPYYYNEAFTNNRIAERYIGGMPNSIAFWLGGVLDATFQAQKTIPVSYQMGQPTPENPIQFTDDYTPPNFDTNNVFNNTTGYFTAPQGGQYTFYVELYVTALHLLAPSSTQLFFCLNTSAGDDYNLFEQTLHSQGHQYFLSQSLTLNLNGGDTVAVRMCTATGAVGDVFRIDNGYFKCTKDVTGGGIYQTYDPNDYSVLLHSFQYPFTQTDFDMILNDIRAMITFNRNGKNEKRGWIEQIKFNHFTNKMDIILTSNKKINDGT